MIDFVAADVLAAWAGGLAAAAAAVSWWRIVGPGFLWLAAGTAALFGLPAVLLAPGPGLAGIVALGFAAVAARRASPAAVGFGTAAALLVIDAMGSGVAGAITAAAFLGGVTAEMLLGHWYLVDPRLPRRALFRLAAWALVGLAGEVIVLATRGVFGWGAGDTILGVAFIVLATSSAVLLVAVWFALREPAYPAVMAATGLSYLAVLTAAGTSVVGRVVLEGVG